ncbi:glycosyltransferase [bacterium]|nr:glycosyltransferase [bacterium]
MTQYLGDALVDHETPNVENQGERARSLRSDLVISVVIPCFNEEDILWTLFERLNAAVSTWGTKYEVVLVDDGSVDRTWSIIEQLHQRNPHWKGLRLGRNFGHQLALRAGLQFATGDIVAVVDADLQDPPELIKEMLGRWEQGFDVVVGVRCRRKEGLFKKSMYMLFYRVLALMADLELPLDAGDFCLMDRRVVDVIRLMPESRPFIRGLRSWVGFRQTLFPYDRAARHAGETKYSYWRLFQLATDGIVSNSRMPLHFATLFGALVSLVAFLGALLTLLIGLFPEFFKSLGISYVHGTASVIISVLFVGGVQLLCLGIIGAYLGRIHENVLHRPLWSIRQVVGIESQRDLSGQLNLPEAVRISTVRTPNGNNDLNLDR